MMYNKNMKKGRLKRGFTIIEVVLFLAISGAILAAIMTNTSATVARRRYSETINDFVEELRNAYSATINVENYRKNTEDASYFCSVSSAFTSTNNLIINSPIDNAVVNPTADNYPGRTKCAVYGQVITFGENYTSDIHRYDLIGIATTDNIDPGDSDEVLASLRAVGANIITMTQTPATTTNPVNCVAGLAGTTSLHRPQWTGTLENKKSNDLYRGAIMIARSPISGTVHTYFYSHDSGAGVGSSINDNPANDETFFVENWIKNTGTKTCNSFSLYKNLFANIDMDKWVNTKDLEICVGSEDLFAVNNKRRAIRIHADGSTESSVELLPETESEVVCKI